eukprot:TRINITY_DN24137_c0_g1_i1.p1 TRINITY_DN24137_c0_g1~~TRINITY_DN24137_c0_g1_i1.p1  ORF type:complete len:327 (-),score=54.92 TRINITY_DN24137_c0_g1_i1:187-1167(-)
MLAAQAGKAAAIELLLANGAKPNLQSGVVQRRKVRHGEVVSRLQLQLGGGGVLTQVGAKFTALHFAVFSGSTDTVDALLKAEGIKVNLQADEEEANSLSPLHVAVSLGCEAIVKALLAAPGIDVNLATRLDDMALDLARSPYRREPLFRFVEDFEPGAAYSGLAALLEEAGGKTWADIDDENKWLSAEDVEKYRENWLTAKGMSPDELWDQAQGLDGRLAAIKLGADVNKAGEMPPLFRAMYFTSRTLARALVEAKADLHFRDESGETALHMAVQRGNQDTVEYLIAQKADVNVVSVFGCTPLDGCRYDSIATVLIEAGAVKGSST